MPRANQRPSCGRCGHPGFSIVHGVTVDGRPYFVCDQCENRWTNGLSGQPYTAAAQGPLRDDLKQKLFPYWRELISSR